MSTSKLVQALLKSDYTTANEITSNLMQTRVQTRLAEERKTAFTSILTEGVGDKKCELCGSKKDLRTADDDTVLCKECDVED